MRKRRDNLHAVGAEVAVIHPDVDTAITIKQENVADHQGTTDAVVLDRPVVGDEVPHLTKDVDTEAEAVRRIVAIPDRALGRVRLIVDDTDQSRSLDRNLRKSRRRSRRNPISLTRRRIKKVRAL